MSDLTTTNCGCGGNDVGFGGNCIWLILILCCCGGLGGNGGCGSGCGGNDNNCLWIIILLCCCGGGNGFC